MHVFDSADVVNRIDINSPPQRLAGDVPDEMPLAGGGVDAVVRVEQFAIEDRWVFAAHGDGVGVCRWNFGARPDQDNKSRRREGCCWC